MPENRLYCRNCGKVLPPGADPASCPRCLSPDILPIGSAAAVPKKDVLPPLPVSPSPGDSLENPDILDSPGPRSPSLERDVRRLVRARRAEGRGRKH